MNAFTVTQRHAAIVAFVSVVLTLIGVIGAVACGVPPDLGLTEDPAAAAERIASSAGAFRLGILFWVLAIVGDVVRAWALYVFFQAVNRPVALLAAWWMLIHDAVFGVGLVGLVLASEVATGGLGVPPELVPAAVGLLLKFHYIAFNVGLLCFSVHLLLNGVLAYTSGFVPRVFGVLLVIAFGGYVVDASATLLLPEPVALIKAIVPLPNTIGELAILVWMIVRGGRPPRSSESSSPSTGART